MRTYTFSGILLFFILALVGCACALSTIQPTVPPTLAPEPKPSVMLPPSLSPTNEPIATETQILADCESTSFEMASPDGNWNAQSCNYYDENAKLIVNGNNRQTWEFMYMDYILPEQGLDDKPFGSIGPKYWSSDSRYLYFYSAIAWDGGGTCFYGFGVQGLFRLDVQTGKVSTILPLLSSSNGDGYRIVFSPTGRRFTYAYEETKFHIIDLQTGQDSKIETDHPAGSFTWSPDGSSLAFSTSQCDYENQKVIHSAIKILKMDGLITNTVIQSDKDFLRVDDWSMPNILTVSGLDYSDYTETIFTVELDKNKISFSATATP